MKKQVASSSVRIIGGELRSRKISFPEILNLRPTADRIRETLFNWLQFDIGGSRCLDLFSGSGALGIESLSRGASAVTFIEKDPIAAAAIRDNLQMLKLDNGSVNCIEALSWLEKDQAGGGKFDIVYLDPPFAHDVVGEVCKKLDDQNLLQPHCKIYVEVSSDSGSLEFPPGWIETKKKKAGKVLFLLMQIEPKI